MKVDEDQETFDAQLENFDLISDIKPLNAFTIEFLSNYYFKNYDFEEFFKQELNLNLNGNIMNEIEQEQELSQLNEALFRKKFKNNSKLMVYLIKSLSIRVFTSIDEINCVQIVQLIHQFMNQIVDKNLYELSFYCLIQILMNDFDMFIDLIEPLDLSCSDSSSVLINKKLFSNTFFIHNLISKQLKTLINLVRKLVTNMSKQDTRERYNLALNCLLGRLFYLCTKSLIKRIIKFNSIMEIDFLSDLSVLYKDIFKTNVSNLIEKALYCIKILQLISLVPFMTLINQYEMNIEKSINGSCKEDENSDKLSTDITSDTASIKLKDTNNNLDANKKKNVYSNLEVLTEKCKNVWELHMIKKSFNYAKGIFHSFIFS